MDEKEAVVKAMRLGASDYLVKPIEPEELKEAIDRCRAASRLPPEEPQAAPRQQTSTSKERGRFTDAPGSDNRT